MENRVQSAEQKLTKLNETFAKKTASLEKLQSAFAIKESKGKVTEDDRYDYRYSVLCKQEDIEELKKKILRAEKNLENAKKKFAEAKAKEIIPECFEGFRDNLVSVWDEHDKKQRERIIKAGDSYYKTIVDGKAQYDWRKYREYDCAISTTDEQIHKANLREATRLIRNLITRCEKKAGIVESFNDLYIANGNFYEGGVAINGVVKGDKGTADVRSIFAGGYNIQRLHVRVLVS